MILTDLRGTNYESQNYGEYIWVFRIAENAICEGAAFDEDFSKDQVDEKVRETSDQDSHSIPAAAVDQTEGHAATLEDDTQAQTLFPEDSIEQNSELKMTDLKISDSMPPQTSEEANSQAASGSETLSDQESMTNLEIPVDQRPVQTESTAELVTDIQKEATTAVDASTPSISSEVASKLEPETQATAELQAEPEPEISRPLPTHVFSKGDPVLLLHTAPDGSIPTLEVQTVSKADLLKSWPYVLYRHRHLEL